MWRKQLWLTVVAVSALVQPASAQGCAELEGHWPGGPATAAAVSGAVAVFASGAMLEIVDVSDPALPQVRGVVDLPVVAEDLWLSGGIVLVAAGAEGLRVIDVSDPTIPTEVGSVALSGAAEAVVRSGSYAFVAAGSAGLSVVNVSNPAAPSEIAVVPTTNYAVGVALDLAAYAYVIDDFGDMRTVDIIDPASPVVVSTETGWFAYSTDVAFGLPHHLYITDANLAGMVWVFDVNDPYDPTYVGDSIFGGVDERPHSIAVADGVAYVGIEDRFQTLSLVIPEWPTPMASVGTSGGAYSVALGGDTAYVAADGAGLRVFDVTNPGSPTEIASIETTGESDGIALSGGLAAVADLHDGLRVLDVSQPSQPVELGVCDTPVHASRVVMRGDLVFVADRATGLRIVDLATPSTPTEVGELPIGDGVVGLDVGGGVAYLVEPYDGLVLVDVTVPSAPAHLATLPLAGALGLDVAVEGGVAVVVARDGFHELVLRVVDVSTPTSPALRGSLDLTGWSSRVAVRGSHAYVVSPGHGMTVVDISDPDQPVVRGAYDPPSNAAIDLDVAAGHAFIADTRGALHVVDVADPTSPSEVDVIETEGGVGVGYSSGRAVVSTGLYGISVVDVGDCLGGEIFADGFESGDTSAWD